MIEEQTPVIGLQRTDSSDEHQKSHRRNATHHQIRNPHKNSPETRLLCSPRIQNVHQIPQRNLQRKWIFKNLTSAAVQDRAYMLTCPYFHGPNPVGSSRKNSKNLGSYLGGALWRRWSVPKDRERSSATLSDGRGAEGPRAPRIDAWCKFHKSTIYCSRKNPAIARQYINLCYDTCKNLGKYVEDTKTRR